MRKTTLVLFAVLLAYFSPWLANADDGLMLALWFNGLPTLAVHWVATESQALALAVDVGVLTVQYLGLFAVIGLLRPLVVVVADFISAPRHRSGLVR